MVLLVLLAGCGDDLAGVGQPCSSSAECAAGLVSDFGRRDHTCQPTLTVRPDMAVRLVEDAGEPLDLAQIPD